MATQRTHGRGIDAGLLAARLGFGLGFFWFHGLPKLLGGPPRWIRTGEAISSFGITFGYEWWGLAAALSEGVGGLLIAAGLLFRPAALAVLAVMITAFTNDLVTGADPPAHSFKNIFICLGLFLAGPGRYSLDRLLARSRRRV